MSSTIVVTITLIIIVLLSMVILKQIPLIDQYFTRFILVGGVNTLNYFLFYTILNLKLEYIYAHIISFLLSSTISFFITVSYTFEESITIKKLIYFPITYLPNLLLSTIGTYIFVYFNIMNESFASLLVMVIAIPITCILSKLLLVRK